MFVDNNQSTHSPWLQISSDPHVNKNNQESGIKASGPSRYERIERVLPNNCVGAVFTAHRGISCSFAQIPVLKEGEEKEREFLVNQFSLIDNSKNSKFNQKYNFFISSNVVSLSKSLYKLHRT